MKLSTKGKYGLKAIFELSLHVNEGPMPLNMIASKQKIPEQYLEQIFSTLKKSKLITSVRGAQGGYFLNEDPEKYYSWRCTYSARRTCGPIAMYY